MNALRSLSSVAAPGLKRLGCLASLDHAAEEALAAAASRSRLVAARRELLVEGQSLREPLLLLSGWAAVTRYLPDGRRQIVSFVLPGEVIGAFGVDQQTASASVLAVTGASICPAPAMGTSPALDAAYAAGAAADHARLVAHVVRLGRMNAQERTADLLLELLERLEPSGLAHQGHYTAPLTQEMLADALGLTPVHVNRTLQTMRRAGEIVWKGHDVHIPNPGRLARSIGRVGPRAVLLAQ